MNEEKERYKLESYNEAFCEIHDTKSDEWYLRKDLITDLLNQQDEEIKDLQNDNEWLCDERQKLRKYVDGLIEKNKQLKQSQKQLAIKELEKLRPLITRQAYICGGKATENEIVEANAYNRCLEDIRDILHNQIKQLEAQNEV